MSGGRPSKVHEIPPSLLQAAHERIDGGAAGAKEIYDALNLSRFVRERWWRQYFSRRVRRRSGVAGSGPATPAATEPRAPRAVLMRAIDALAASIERGEIPAYSLAPAVTALVKTLQHEEVALTAERRAADLHEQKLVELRRSQEQAAGEMAREGVLTPELLGEIKSRVLGL